MSILGRDSSKLRKELEEHIGENATVSYDPHWSYASQHREPRTVNIRIADVGKKNLYGNHETIPLESISEVRWKRVTTEMGTITR